MLTPKNDCWESSLFVQRHASRRRAKFVRNMEESLFPSSAELIDSRFLYLGGDQGSLLMNPCRFSGDYYERVDSAGRPIRGRIDLLAETGLQAILLSPAALAARLLESGYFAHIQRVSDGREFEVALLTPFPTKEGLLKFAGGIWLKNDQMESINVEPKRRSINLSKDRYLLKTEPTPVQLQHHFSTFLKSQL